MLRGCLLVAGGALLGAVAAVPVTFLAALWIFTPVADAGHAAYSGHAAAGVVAMSFALFAGIPGAVVGGVLSGWISIRRSRAAPKSPQSNPGVTGA